MSFCLQISVSKISRNVEVSQLQYSFDEPCCHGSIFDSKGISQLCTNLSAVTTGAKITLSFKLLGSLELLEI